MVGVSKQTTVSMNIIVIPVEKVKTDYEINNKDLGEGL